MVIIFCVYLPLPINLHKYKCIRARERTYALGSELLMLVCKLIGVNLL